MGTIIQLTRKDARTVARLLREFQLLLESAIESSIAPGETEAFAAIDKPHVASDRIKFKSAERLIRKIDIALGDRKPNRRTTHPDTQTSSIQTKKDSPK